MFDASMIALARIFTVQHFTMMFLGMLLGVVLGIIPGLGGYVGVALLLPIVLYMDPYAAMITIIAMHAVVDMGGAVTAVLFGVPGTGQNVATCFDGYPMTQKGKGGVAAGAAIFSSVFGAIIGAAALVFLIPIVRPLVMAFGVSEFFLMVMVGIACIVTMATEDAVKGFIMAGFGILLSLVGQDVATGIPRFVFGISYLWDGLKLNPVVLGQIAISEMVIMAAKGGAIASEGGAVTVRVARRELFEGLIETFRHWWLFVKSSVIGIVVGIIPGLGGEAAALIAYGMAKQSSKNPEKFGTGIIEGVIAPETANSSKEGGVLLPTVAFGIPGSGVMAILLGVFIIFGITPGKKMLGEQLPLTLSMAWTTCFTNVMGAVLLFFTSSYLLPLTRLPIALSMPTITIFILVGSFSTLYQVGDLVITFAFALLGCYAWKKAGYSIAPFILAFILGKEAERNFRLAYSIHGPFFFIQTPISVVLCICFVLAMGYPLLKKWWLRRKRSSSQEESAKPLEQKVERAVPIVFLCLVLLFLYDVITMEISSSKTLPLMMIIPMIFLLLYEITVQFRRPRDPAGKTSNIRREVGVWIWLALTIACVWLFSWIIAIPLAMIAISRIFFQRSWRTTLLVALPLWALIIICFGVWLKMPMGQGQLLTLYYF